MHKTLDWRIEPLYHSLLSTERSQPAAHHRPTKEEGYDLEGADPARDPHQSFDHKFLVEQEIDRIAYARAKVTDANSYTYMTRTLILHDVGYGYGPFQEALKRVKAKVLMISTPLDLFYPLSQSDEIVEVIRQDGGDARHLSIESDEGHGVGITEIQKVGEEIRRFLNER